MLYAIFCYQAEGAVCAMSHEEDQALMEELVIAKQRLSKKIRFGPVARLMPTTAAVTVREGKQPMVFDGPFAETKEQLLGFYIVDCNTLEEAIEAAQGLMAPRAAAGLAGALEIRPLQFFEAGSAQ